MTSKMKVLKKIKQETNKIVRVQTKENTNKKNKVKFDQERNDSQTCGEEIARYKMYRNNAKGI